MNHDIEERLITFCSDCIRLARKNKDRTTFSLLDQLVRAAGSIGANYQEAQHKESSKDFLHKLAIARKESRECLYWIKVLKSSVDANSEVEALVQEATEINKIMSSIFYNYREKIKASI